MINNKRWGSWAQKPETIDPSTADKEYSAEILVIGAGLSGLSCALSAAQKGADVLCLEKFGKYTARGFNIGVCNSSYMASRGFENDVDAVAREWIKRCGNRCDEKLVRLFLNRSGEAMDWLMGMLTSPEYAIRPELQGCLYKGETYYEIMGSHLFYDGPISKQGKFGGLNDVMEPMYQEALKAGVRFVFNSPLQQLIVEDGRVTGAIAQNKEGEIIALRGQRGVVIATGGIGGNDEMCDDLCPIANKVAAKVCAPKGSDNGDGHRAALWAGAAFEDGPFPAMLHPQAHRHSNFCFLFVRPDGKRYMNEDNYLQARAYGVIKEGLKWAWAIFDSDWREKVPETLKYGGGIYWGHDFPLGRKDEFQLDHEEERLEWGLRIGAAVMADTPEELAEKMGVDPKVFAETLANYNRMCAEGKDTEFGKRKELLIPLDKPPYIARKFGPALLSVVGGMKVNTSMQVLTEEGEVIPGLYAIGNAAGGRYGVDYPMLIPGNSHGTALTFGYLLGRELGGKD
ncbi:MAG: FAD-dependent oxidoreductase [Oscillospiraceae bacterium]|nr:FAD-dependent oxidoreductase [Oscillospiraceae bacterium]